MELERSNRIISVLSEIFRDNKFRPEDLSGFENKLFFEGERQRPFLVKFFVLVFLSTIIAVYGVLNDSPATVIGAMIVAPLMTPTMATSAALVMGSMPRTIMSLLLVAAGIFLDVPKELEIVVTGMLVGGIITNIMNEELPDKEPRKILHFIAGVVLITIVAIFTRSLPRFVV